LLVSGSVSLIAFLNVSNDSAKVFGYLTNVVVILGLLSWISILVTHIYFVRARKAQGIPEETLAYKAPFGVWGSYIALSFCILIAVTKNFTAFMAKKKDKKTFDRRQFTEDFITG
jgi:amino acid transporter